MSGRAQFLAWCRCSWAGRSHRGFSGTPTALKLVHRMRAAYQKLPAVENVRTGRCSTVRLLLEGWDYAPSKLPS
jgi:hypothetical protein